MSDDHSVQTPPQRLSSGEEVLALLKKMFPKTFFDNSQDIRPLKINIHLDIRQVLGEVCSNKAIERALKLYAKQPAYHNLLKLNTQRIDLEGNLCGEVTDEHIQFAKNAKEKIKHLKSQRKKLQQEFPDDLQPSVRGRLELTLKINTLPQDVKFSNGMNQFMVQVDNKPVRVSLRNKGWNKIEKAPNEYGSWIALMRGKIGAPVEKQGFELVDPIIQIFERKVTSDDTTASQKPAERSHNTTSRPPSVGMRNRNPARGQATPPVVIGVKRKFEGVVMQDVPPASDAPAPAKKTLTLKKKT
jgi:ProQ/FINO family